MTQRRANPTCLNCGAEFEASSISARQRFARCSHCGALHNVASWFRGEQLETEIPVSMPAGLEYEETSDGASVSIFAAAKRSAAYIVAVSVVVGLGIFAILTWAAGAALALAGVALWATAVFIIYLSMRREEPETEELNFQVRPQHIAVAADRVLFNFNHRKFRYENSIEAKHVKGFVAVQNQDNHQIKIVDRAGNRWVVASDIASSLVCEVGLYLLEHAVHKARSATRRGAAATPPIAEAPRRQDQKRPAISPRLPRPKQRFPRGGAPAVTGFTQVKSRETAGVRRLQCKGCGAPIKLDRIDRKERLGTCGYCGRVQDVSEFLRVQRPTQRKLVLPHGYHFASTDDELLVAQEFSQPIHVHSKPLLMLAITSVLVCVASCIAMIVLLPPAFWALAIVPIALAAFMGMQYGASCAQVTGTHFGLDRYGLRRGRAHTHLPASMPFGLPPVLPEHPDFYHLDLDRVSQFIPQAYRTFDGGHRFAVFVEDAGGQRRIVASGLTYSRSAFVLAERLTERHARLLAEAA